VGKFVTRPGPILAATDEFTIAIHGKGGHAAKAHNTIDPIIVGTALIQGFQTIVSRSVDPVKAAVVSVTAFHAGEAHNVIADIAELRGTCRSFDPDVRVLLERRMKEIAAGTAASYGATIDVAYKRGYPSTRNHPDETVFAAGVAAGIVGPGNVEADAPPVMGGEDFAYMLEKRPGAFVFIGNGDTASLHNAAYDFNDEIIPIGCSYWARLIETAMPA
jgi:hippurate hydrolase